MNKKLAAVLGSLSLATAGVAFAEDKAPEKTEKAPAKDKKAEGKKGSEKSCKGEKGCSGKAGEEHKGDKGSEKSCKGGEKSCSGTK